MDIAANSHVTAEVDWFSGKGNALSLGAACVCPNQRTTLNPALLYSNDTKRIDGFSLTVQHQLNW